jgi:hypothetical protein
MRLDDRATACGKEFCKKLMVTLALISPQAAPLFWFSSEGGRADRQNSQVSVSDRIPGGARPRWLPAAFPSAAGAPACLHHSGRPMASAERIHATASKLAKILSSSTRNHKAVCCSSVSAQEEA